MNLEKALKIIRELIGKRKSADQQEVYNTAWRCIYAATEEMTVDISAACGFDIEPRYHAQIVEIPAKKRGNLSKYRGKQVVVIPTTIARNGARINFLIKEVTRCEIACVSNFVCKQTQENESRCQDPRIRDLRCKSLFNQ